jgi:hypothetical protein
MPQLLVDRSSRIEPQMALPLDQHPLHRLRKATIIVTAIGILLSFLSVGPYAETAFGSLVVILVVSALFCAADLRHYAERKARHPERDPCWPEKSWTAGDLILAIILLGAFFIGLGTLMSTPYYYPSAPQNVARAYAALAALICW